VDQGFVGHGFSRDIKKLSSGLLTPDLQSALEAAEKVKSKRLLVAQALLPVLVLPHLPSMHSQEWLCYSIFSATSKADAP
jgi:hypothetical protein